VNLVSNIGFGHQGATHTTNAKFNPLANIPTLSIEFPLKHPVNFEHHVQGDIYTMVKYMFPSFFIKLFRAIRSKTWFLN
jgi:hypothetical protein